MTTLAIIFGIVLLGRVYFDIKYHENMLTTKKNILNEDIQKIFKLAEQNLVNKYYMLTKHLMNDKIIYDYFKSDKREKLHILMQEDYKQLKQQDPNLKVMHFIDTNNITVLRMHKPKSFDDDLTKKRPIVVYANKSLKNQHAFEVGKNGTVYRITTPFIYKNEHIGVLEFGIKPKYFVDMLNKQFGVKSQILVKTKSLKTLVAQKNYNTIGEYSIISRDPFLDQIIKQLDLTNSNQLVEIDGKTYIVFNNLNIPNFQGEIVSKIIVTKDITHLIQENRSLLILINSITLMIFLLILTILYIVLSKFSGEIKRNIKTITSLHHKSNYLQNKANTDELTKAFNKRYFDIFLTDFINENREGSIIFFDIDHFKKTNDTHGHLAGDEILKKLSLTIKSFLREDDTFVRWGGEEFIILIENFTLELANHKANSIRELIETTKFYNNIPITISIGVAQIEIGDTKETLLKRADELLYKAKNSGRNCVKC